MQNQASIKQEKASKTRKYPCRTQPDLTQRLQQSKEAQETLIEKMEQIHDIMNYSYREGGIIIEYQNPRRIDTGQHTLTYPRMRLSNVYIAAGQTREATQKLSAGVSSDLGRVRTINEDNFLLLHVINEHFSPTFEYYYHQDLVTNSWRCFAIFDGIGGLKCGELAAHLTAEVFRDIATGLVADLPCDEIDCQIQDGFSFANQEVRKLRKAKCGTTGTIVCTNGEQFKVYHIGDCRTYLFRSNNLFQLGLV